MSTLRRSLLPIILLQLHTLSGGPAAAKVPAVIVFGDSTVDTGNNNYISTVIRSDFAPYGRDLRVGGGGGTSGQPTGRFSNGRLAVDFISEAFGLPPLVPAYLDPNADMSSLATGACFASAGAGYDNATSDLFASRRVHFHASSDAGRSRSTSNANAMVIESFLCLAVRPAAVEGA